MVSLTLLKALDLIKVAIEEEKIFKHTHWIGFDALARPAGRFACPLENVLGSRWSTSGQSH